MSLSYFRYLGWGRAATRAVLGWIRPVPIRRPVFIVGTVRSGTTLVARCLGRHPDLLYLRFELSDEWVRFGGIKIATPENGIRECPPIEREAATAEQVRRVHKGFARLFAGRGGRGGVRAVNKNPHLLTN